MSRPPRTRASPWGPRPPGTRPMLVTAETWHLSTARQALPLRLHTRAVVSSLAVKSRRRPGTGWKASARTGASWPLKLCVQCPLRVSHTRADRSALPVACARGGGVRHGRVCSEQRSARARSAPVASQHMSFTGNGCGFQVRVTTAAYETPVELAPGLASAASAVGGPPGSTRVSSHTRHCMLRLAVYTACPSWLCVSRKGAASGKEGRQHEARVAARLKQRAVHVTACETRTSMSAQSQARCRRREWRARRRRRGPPGGRRPRTQWPARRRVAPGGRRPRGSGMASGIGPGCMRCAAWGLSAPFGDREGDGAFATTR